MHNICTIQIFKDCQWITIAYIHCDAPESMGVQSPSKVIYEAEYAFHEFERQDAAALSWGVPVDITAMHFSKWPPFLVDLLPQGFGRSELLKHIGLPAHAEVAGDWPLLLKGAGNPIGHLRVLEAYSWLKDKSPDIPLKGFERQEILGRSEDFIESLTPYGLFITGSSGTQGEWPKLLLTEANDGLFYLDHALPDAEAKQHWLVKFHRGENQNMARIFTSEAAYMRLAIFLGLRVHGELEIHGKALFIPRFDRTVRGGTVERHAQESIAVLCGYTGFGMIISNNEICRKLAEACSDPLTEIVEYLKRDITNIMLGNRDNHSRNTAIKRGWDGIVALTPLFDFAPMFLHPDGISRNSRWDKNDAGAPKWASVIEQISDSTSELIHIPGVTLRQILMDWLPTLKKLENQMTLEGLDTGIIDYCTPRIRDVCQQIEDL